MKTKELLRGIKGIFKSPKKKYYLRKAQGYPYFFPTCFVPSIFKIRKLIRKTEEQTKEYLKKYPYLKQSNNTKYNNYPMVNRSKSWIKTIFGNDYLIVIGCPFCIDNIELGWKDKYSSPRYEWSPSFHIYFFWWQFSIFLNSPDGDNDQYYEQILWYLQYSDKDIIKAKETWPWQNFKTKKSTWNDKYLQ